MAQESSKATKRRLQDTEFWNPIFGTQCLDVGAGDDPAIWPGCQVTPFDQKDGDANKIDEYFEPGQFDCIHGSQVMEHLYDPTGFVNRCLRILTPGGWIVMTVPDFDLYEKRTFPSKYNPDHKTTWSLWRPTVTDFRSMRSGGPVNTKNHIHVPTWLSKWTANCKVEARLIDTNYDYLKPDSVDQTWKREDGVECFIELLWQKPA